MSTWSLHAPPAQLAPRTDPPAAGVLVLPLLPLLLAAASSLYNSGVCANSQPQRNGGGGEEGVAVGSRRLVAARDAWRRLSRLTSRSARLLGPTPSSGRPRPPHSCPRSACGAPHTLALHTLRYVHVSMLTSSPGIPNPTRARANRSRVPHGRRPGQECHVARGEGGISGTWLALVESRRWLPRVVGRMAVSLPGGHRS